MPVYQLLTDRTLAQSSAITPTTLIHIVYTGDPSQNPAGSSYKAELGQLVGLFGGTFTGGTVSGATNFTGGLSANTISATTYNNLPVSGLTEGSNISISGTNGNFTISVTGITGGSTFTGGTVTGSTTFTNGLSANTISATTIGDSGDCVDDIYVSNIHSCSPLNINPLDEGNVYFGSTSGVTVDVTNSRLGIGTNNPQYPIEVNSNNSQLFYNPTSAGGLLVVSGQTSIPRMGVIIPPYLTNPSAAVTLGLRAWDDVIFTNYGNVGDTFLRATDESNGLNLINSPGVGTQDYIRFYAGNQATATPDIHIQGSGATRGYVGIGTVSPSETLDVIGKTKTINFQMTSGANNGYVLTSDASGNASWQASTGGGTFTGGTVSGATNFTNGLTANTFSAGSIFVNGIQITGDTFVTGGTFLIDTLTFTNNQGNNFQVTGITASGTTFTGGSGNCIADLYVTNIHSCSPLNINPLNEGNVYFGSTSGVTIDVINSRIGIGAQSPSESLDVSGKIKTINFQMTSGGTNGYVLTSDSNGNGSWQPSSGGSSGKIGIPDSLGSYTFYSDLNSAMTDAVLGDTIVFFTDVIETGSVSITLKNGVNINFNGFSYTLNNGGSLSAFVGSLVGGSMKFINGVINRLNGSAGSYVLNLSNMTITSENVVFNSNTGYAINQTSGIIYNPSVIGHSGINIVSGTIHNANIYVNTGDGLTAFGTNTYVYNSVSKTNGIAYGIAAAGTSVNIINCTGLAVFGFGLVIAGNSTIAESCVGYSDSNYGIYVGQAGALSNCNAISPLFVALRIENNQRTVHNNISAWSNLNVGSQIVNSSPNTIVINGFNCFSNSTTSLSLDAQGSSTKIQITGLNSHTSGNMTSHSAVSVSSTGNIYIGGGQLTVTTPGAYAISAPIRNMSYGNIVFKIPSGSTPVNPNITNIVSPIDTYGNLIIID